MQLKGTFILIEEGWHLFWDNLGVLWRHARFSLFMQIASYIVLGLSIGVIVILGGVSLANTSVDENSSFSTIMAIMAFLLLLVAIIGFIGSWIYSSSYTISIIKSLGDRYQNNEADTKDKYRLILPMIGISIMVGVIILGGLILLIIPALIFWTFFAFSVTARIIDGHKGVKALTYSRSLSRGRFWKVFGRLLLINIIFLAIASMVNYLPQFVGWSIMAISDSTSTAIISGISVIILFIVSIVAQILLSAFFLAISVVFYFNLRETLSANSENPLKIASPEPIASATVQS